MRFLSNCFGKTKISKGTRHQLLAGFCSCIAMMSASSSYVWLAPQFDRFSLDQGEIPMNSEQFSWIISIFEIGNLVISIPAGCLVNITGRKSMILFTVPLFVVSWILVLLSKSYEALLVVRVLQGLGLGLLYTALPIYLAEISSPKIRGAIGYFFFGGYYIGTLFDYVVGPFTSYYLNAILTMIPPVIFLLTFIWFPESPYQYLIWQKEKEAGEALAWFRGKTQLEIKDELGSLTLSVEEQMRTKSSVTDLFKAEEVRKTLAILHLVGLTFCLAGGTAIFTYATDTFAKSGEALLSPAISSIILGVTVMITILIAAPFVDRSGRRPILLISCFGTAFSLLLTSLYYFLIQENFNVTPIKGWFPVVTVVAYATFIGAGIESLQPGLQAEMLPDSLRGIGCSVVRVSMCAASFLCLKMYHITVRQIGLYFVYLMYALVSFFGGILIYIYVPETKGKTFHEIQALLKKH